MLRSGLSKGIVEVGTDLPKISQGMIGELFPGVPSKCLARKPRSDSLFGGHALEQFDEIECWDFDDFDPLEHLDQQQTPYYALEVQWVANKSRRKHKKANRSIASDSTADDASSNGHISSDTEAPHVEQCAPVTADDLSREANVHVQASDQSGTCLTKTREEVLRNLVTTLKSQQRQAEENITLAEERCRKAEELASSRLKAAAEEEERRARDARREADSSMKHAKHVERHRSLKQHKTDERDRKRTKLVKKMVETVEEDAHQKCEEIKRNAFTDALALRTRANAEAKAMRAEAEQLRAAMVASAEQEVEAIKLRAIDQAKDVENMVVESTPVRMQDCSHVSSSKEPCPIASAKERVLRNLVSTLKSQQKQAERDIERAEQRCRQAEELAAIRLKDATLDEEKKARQARRESASALKSAKLAERKRSQRQQKVDEQERKREQLKRKIIESAEEAARQEVEEIKQQAAAEVLALKSQAKAKAKALRTDALRLRGSLLASAKKEAQQMREQAHRDVEQLGSTVSTANSEVHTAESHHEQDLPEEAVLSSRTLQEEEESRKEHVQEHQCSDDDGAFESACEWEVLNELTARVDEEDDSWVIG